MNKSLNQILLAALAAGCTTTAQAGFLTSVMNYAVPTTSEYSVIPILSVNDRVPLTGDASKEFRMIGIPDGLGAHTNTDGTLTLFMNHKLRNTVTSQPVTSQPVIDGPQTTAGVWETSGIIDVSGFFGAEAWLFDVQAHSPTPAPAAQTVEDGQLLIMIRNP